MSRLRCWPGAVCRITRGPFRDHVITVTRTVDLPLPGAFWLYEGPPVEFGPLHVVESFADSALQPIVPRPGTMTDIIDIPIHDQTR